MGYRNQRSFRAGQRSTHDVFGNLRVVNPFAAFNSAAQYDLAPLVWQNITSGTGNTIAHDANRRTAVLTLGGVQAGYCVRQTYLYIPYQEGRAQRLSTTGIIGPTITGVTRQVGLFDARDGLFIQQNDAGFAFVIRSSTSGSVIETTIPQAQWNVDRFDGTGPSRITIDWEKNQFFDIGFGWLGAADVAFGFYLDGMLRLAHIEPSSNELTSSYMRTGTLPISIRLFCSSPASATMIANCHVVYSEGGYFTSAAYQFSGKRPLTSYISTTSEVPLIAVRPGLTLNGIVNRVFTQVLAVSVGVASNPIDWRVLYFPPGLTPITGGAWTQPTHSATEFNTTATAINLTGGIEIASGDLSAGVGGVRGAASSSIRQLYPLTLDACGSNSPLTSNVGGNPAHIVVTGLGAGATAGASIEVAEIR